MPNRSVLEKPVFLFFAIAIALLSLTPILEIGFTTTDNMWSHLRVRNGDSLSKEAVKGMKDMGGRIMMLFHVPMDSFPFLSQTWSGFQAIKGAIHLLNTFLFAWLIARIANNRSLGILAFALFWVVVQNSWNHNALTAYVVAFGLPLAFIFVSLHAALKDAESENPGGKWAIVAAVFYFCSTFAYEAFLPYVAMVALIYLNENKIRVGPISEIVDYHWRHLHSLPICGPDRKKSISGDRI